MQQACRRPRTRRSLIVGPALLATAGATALALTLVLRQSAQAPLAFMPPNALVLARQAGSLAVGLALQPKRSTTTLVATVLGPDGSGVSGLDASLTLKTAGGVEASGKGRACGPGCYEATLTRTTGRPSAATVSLADRTRNESATFALPKSWPPPPATKLVSQAATAYRRLRTLVTHERLAADHTHAVSTVYQAVAPNRLHFTITNGTEAIIIGDRRWDKDLGHPWSGSPQAPIHSIIPYWVTTPVNPFLLGSDSVGGHAVWVVSFVTPPGPRVVHDLDRQEDTPNPRASDDRGGALHAPPLRPLQRAVDDQPARAPLMCAIVRRWRFHRFAFALPSAFAPLLA